MSQEGIYLLHTRELYNLYEYIYKLGRSKDLDNRVKQYPKGSKIIFMIKCNNSIFCEKKLIEIFKKKFIQKLDYGTEYFEGNYLIMIKEICNFIENYELTSNSNKNNNNINNIFPINNIIKNNKMNKDIKCNSCNKEFKYQSHLERHKKNIKKCYIEKAIEVNNIINITDITDITDITNITNITDITDNNDNTIKFNKFFNLIKDQIESNNKFLKSIIMKSNNNIEKIKILNLFKYKMNIIYNKIIENINNKTKTKNKENKEHICIECNKIFSDRHSLFKHNKFNRCKGNTTEKLSTGTTFNDILNINIDIE